MASPIITRVEASTDVDVYKSWFNAQGASPIKRVSEAQSAVILAAVRDDDSVSFKEVDLAYALLQSLHTTRNEISNLIVAGYFEPSTENFARLGRAQQNLELAQKLYADMILDYIDENS